MASQSFLQLAELAETAGDNASQWFERAYAENPSDSKIALAYGKSLLSRGEAGAAIFIFEPLVHSGDASLELRDLYAQALLAADRCVESEPLIWQLFEQNPARMHQVVSLIGKMIDSELDAEAVALARKLEVFQRRRGERRSFIATMQELLASHPSVGGDAGVSGRALQCVEPRNRLRAGIAEAVRSVLREARLPESGRVSRPGGGGGSLRAGTSETTGGAARQDRRSALQGNCIALRRR